MKAFKFLYIFSILLIGIAAITAFNNAPGEFSTGTGIRSFASQDLPDTVNASTALVNSDLVVPVAASQKVHIKYSLPFSLAAVQPGIKFQVTVPTGGVSYNSSMVMYSDADSVVAVSVITSAAAQGFTLATTGNHLAVIEFDYVNGSTAGNVSLQFAQNVSNASNTILLRGAFADVIKY